jgi:hypothetical protein
VAQPTEPDPPSAEEPRAERAWGGPPTALAAVLALAATVRLIGIRHGLPYPGLVDSGEEGVLRRAWRMSHGGGFDPHRFRAPTGFLELLAVAEAPFAHPSLLAARLLVAALGVGAVAATWWLASTYGVVSGAVAAAAVAVETASVAHAHAATDGAAVLVTLLVAVALALAVRGRLFWAALAAGIATSVAYVAVLLVVPLAILAGRRGKRHALGAGVFCAAFLLASPFAALHWDHALPDGWRTFRGIGDTTFGYEHDLWAGFAYAGHLWHGFGPVVLVALLGGGLALAQRRQRADVLLPAFAAAFLVALCFTGGHPDRLTLPLVPVVATLAARVRYLAAVTLLLLVVPLTWTLRADAKLTRTDTRVAALAWIAKHVEPGNRIAEDPFVPRPRGLDVLALEVPGPKRRHDPYRSLAHLRAVGVDYVLVSGAIADRVRAARDVYPRDAAFYAALARRTPAVRFAASTHDSGPWIAVYRL